MGIKTYKAYSYKFASSPGKMYTTLLLENGEVTCNCPGWTRRVAEDGSRTCKHCEDVKKKHDYIAVLASLEREKIDKTFEEPAEKTKEEVFEMLDGKKKTETKSEDVPAAERTEKMFEILREYGYLCFRNYYHQRQTAIKQLSMVIASRKEKDIPVSGCIWLDRAWTKDVDSGVSSFKVNVLVPDGNKASVIHGEVMEAAGRCALQVTSPLSDLASSGFILLQKTETVLPF